MSISVKNIHFDQLFDILFKILSYLFLNVFEFYSRSPDLCGSTWITNTEVSYKNIYQCYKIYNLNFPSNITPVKYYRISIATLIILAFLYFYDNIENNVKIGNYCFIVSFKFSIIGNYCFFFYWFFSTILRYSIIMLHVSYWFYHIISYSLIFFHIFSYLFIFYHIFSYLFIFYHIFSYFFHSIARIKIKIIWNATMNHLVNVQLKMHYNAPVKIVFWIHTNQW